MVLPKLSPCCHRPEKALKGKGVAVSRRKLKVATQFTNTVATCRKKLKTSQQQQAPGRGTEKAGAEQETPVMKSPSLRQDWQPTVKVHSHDTWPFSDAIFVFPWSLPFSLLLPEVFVPAECDLVPHCLSLLKKKLYVYICTCILPKIHKWAMVADINLTSLLQKHIKAATISKQPSSSACLCKDQSC